MHKVVNDVKLKTNIIADISKFSAVDCLGKITQNELQFAISWVQGIFDPQNMIHFSKADFMFRMGLYDDVVTRKLKNL